MPSVSLLPFQPERHLPLLATWLSDPLVARGWGDPARILPDLAARTASSAAVIAVDGDLVGFLCWQRLAPSELEAAGLAGLPADLMDVDILLGEPRARGQGIGPAALLQLFARLADEGVAHVGLATALANPRAIAAFAKAGLLPCPDVVGGAEPYRYFTKALRPPP